MNNTLFYKLALPLLSLLLLNGCVTDTSAMNEQAPTLQQLAEGNPEADAAAALDNNDFRFMALPLRGTVIPGVDSSKSLQYELRCGIRFIQGVSDAVRSEEQLKLMKQAHKYAARYNAVVLTRCNP